MDYRAPKVRDPDCPDSIGILFSNKYPCSAIQHRSRVMTSRVIHVNGYG
jgi:hypothetical protein